MVVKDNGPASPRARHILVRLQERHGIYAVQIKVPRAPMLPPGPPPIILVKALMLRK